MIEIFYDAGAESGRLEGRAGGRDRLPRRGGHRRDFGFRTADTVIFETVFTLERVYKQSKEAIRDAFLPLIQLPGIVLPGKRRFRRVFLYYTEKNISFADAYHAVLMESLRLR